MASCSVSPISVRLRRGWRHLSRAASGCARTAIRGTADLAVDNLDVESLFAEEGITEEDLRST